MADVFLSYAAENRAFGRRLAEALGKVGWSVWWDRKIPPGLTFAEVIERELSECHCVVVVWSAQSVGSQWVRTEANEARERGILVPVRIDDAKLPFEFRHLHAADLGEWSGSLEHPEFTAVVARVREFTDRTRAAGLPQGRSELHGATELPASDVLRPNDPTQPGIPHPVDTGVATGARVQSAARRLWPVKSLRIAAVAVVALILTYGGYHIRRTTSIPDAARSTATTSAIGQTGEEKSTTAVAPASRPLESRDATPAGSKPPTSAPERPTAPSTAIDQTAGRRSAIGLAADARTLKTENTSPPRRTPQPQSPGANGTPTGLNRSSPLQPVFFSENSAMLTTEARAILDGNIAALKQYSSWQITIEGHSEEGGDPELNLALGERRALAARDYLVAAGISRDRLRTVSYGMEFPFSQGEADKWKNRRAHFVVTAR